MSKKIAQVLKIIALFLKIAAIFLVVMLFPLALPWLLLGYGVARGLKGRINAKALLALRSAIEAVGIAPYDIGPCMPYPVYLEIWHGTADPAEALVALVVTWVIICGFHLLPSRQPSNMVG